MNMMPASARVLVIGKYYPLVGGTVNHTVEWIEALLAVGVDVDVLTLPEETETVYKIKSYTPQSHFAVAARITRPAVSYRVGIPSGTPWPSYLAGAGIRLGVHAKYAAVIAFPMEPFGLAGGILADELQIPLFLAHAGSDLFGLAQVDELAPTYSWLIKKASGVFATMQGAREFVNLGVPREVLFPVKRLRDTLLNSDLDFHDEDARSRISRNNHRPLRILCYGKQSNSKGLIELIDGCSLAVQSGIPISITLIGAGDPAFEAHLHRSVRRAVDSGLVVDRAGFVAHESILAMLPSFDLAVHLEEESHVVGHLSSVPYEIVSSGVPVLISRHSLEKAAGALRWLEYSGSAFVVNEVTPLTVRECLEETAQLGVSRLREIGLRGRSALTRHLSGDNSLLSRVDLGSYLRFVLDLAPGETSSINFQQDIDAFRLLV